MTIKTVKSKFIESISNNGYVYVDIIVYDQRRPDDFFDETFIFYRVAKKGPFIIEKIEVKNHFK
jgi:hypothetical protein